MGSTKDPDPNLAFLTKRDTEVNLPRPTGVKNKTPASIQITAEQILGEARERPEPEIRPPKQKITDVAKLRYWEIECARSIHDRFVGIFHHLPSAWIAYAKFEMENGEIAKARAVYERAVEYLSEEDDAEVLFVAFAEFEERRKETDRARFIYKYALDHIPEGRAEDLYRKFVAFEKQCGDREGIEDAIVSKRSFQYEEEVRKNPFSYDTWFDYIRLEEQNAGNGEMIRGVYERAIGNVPPAEEKRYWQRYIYLWINYALYEELEAEDMDRTRYVYRECLKLIPHKKFSFAKIWLLAAQFEIRQNNVKAARRILGNAIGRAPKDKIFKKYIEIELQLGNLDRCRTLYEKYLEWAPANCYAWSKYAELAKSLRGIDCARGIFELAIAQPALDMPELLWKAYIDFEISEREFERTRQLYERHLDRKKHLKVWISFAKFEAFGGVEDEVRDGKEQPPKEEGHERMERLKRCRGVFERAIDYYRTTAPYTLKFKEERVMLLKEWLNIENKFGSIYDVANVQKKFPMKVQKWRDKTSKDGTPSGYEEYTDYSFRGEDGREPCSKIVFAAYKWKSRKLALERREAAYKWRAPKPVPYLLNPVPDEE